MSLVVAPRAVCLAHHPLLLAHAQLVPAAEEAVGAAAAAAERPEVREDLEELGVDQVVAEACLQD